MADSNNDAYFMQEISSLKNKISQQDDMIKTLEKEINDIKNNDIKDLRNEIHEIKKYEWGVSKDPPLISGK